MILIEVGLKIIKFYIKYLQIIVNHSTCFSYKLSGMNVVESY